MCGDGIEELPFHRRCRPMEKLVEPGFCDAELLADRVALGRCVARPRRFEVQ